MPNHITNIVKIEGTKEKIQECFDKIKGKEKNGEQCIIDFGKIIRMPDHIYRGDVGVKEEQKYGKENCWYDWCIKNWGTKWNAYNQSMLEDNIFYFETAWSCPAPVLFELSNQNPDLLFSISYADEDIGSNCGHFILYRGELLTEYTPTGKKAEKFALNVTSGRTQNIKECSNIKIEIIKALNRNS